MPNWTMNRVRIATPKELLEKFIADGRELPKEDRIDGHKYSFESWIPRPKEFDLYDTTNYDKEEHIRRLAEYSNSKILVDGEMVPVNKDNVDEIVAKYKEAAEYQKKTYGVVGWYDWNRINWGTKWDAGFDINRISDTEAEIVLDTAWTAPDAFFCEIGRRYGDEMDIMMHSHFEDSLNLVYFICGESCSCDAPESGEYREYLVKYVNDNTELDEETKKKRLALIDDYIGYDCWDCTVEPEDDADNFDYFCENHEED